MSAQQRPLELILARNLLSSISTPAFLVGEEGELLFFNEAAAAMLGRRFEETGTLAAAQWIGEFGPFGDDRTGRLQRRDRNLLACIRGRAARGRTKMRIKVWGARGSIPAPGPETMRYGGNTSCVEVTLSDGSTLILDAGTGIRNLGLALPRVEQPINILLTHLHLDHIQGLMFFAPAFRPESEIVIWGPASPEASLCDRVARYISAPLAPVEVRELPSLVSFREADTVEWEIGPARIRAQAVNHRGPTLGYRIDDGGTSLCYIPDHEPGLGARLTDLSDDWISGFELARGASMLIHDCQYTDQEYRAHVGWGHSPMSDALGFANRVSAQRLLLFHHDPLHSDDFLDSFSGEITSHWQELGGSSEQVKLAAECHEIALAGQAAQAV